ncbi:hypothetical protein J4E08_03545 [Sagittula sp. NFXS13]|uniref:Uncharacterized protein n=1 Tax=Sagittula marina TaxID=943940 RepID=A0A7W6DQX2_9RHOB|nr:hypothetical protein [Sagittula marina]MBB3985272.1 hypothetical protein [Sagittula marina]
MLLERTISQLDIGPVHPGRATEMGRMGYLQWLGALPGHSGYAAEAQRALAMAQIFADGSPAVAVFCALLRQSLDTPLQPMTLAPPPRVRRGGARTRRLMS